MKQHEFLIEAFKLVVKSGLFPEATMTDWVMDLLWLHTRGYLLASFDEKGKLEVVACVYRMKKVPKGSIDVYPIKSEGKVLFIPWIASESNDANTLKKMVNFYLKGNKDIKTICFHDSKDDGKLKVYNRKTKKVKKKRKKKKVKSRVKGDKYHGRKKEARHTGTSKVSRRS